MDDFSPVESTRSVILRWQTDVGSSPPEVFIASAASAEAERIGQFIRQTFDVGGR